MSKIILGIYDDDHALLLGAKALKEKSIRVSNVYSPFPVHGIDEVIGVPRTRLAICSFLLGVTGLSLGLLMMWYMMIYDWPINIGGKPNFALYLNLPAFIPVAFECTVLGAAHGMAITFFLRSWLLPGVSPKNPDPRTTDDAFVIEIKVADETKSDEIASILKQTGAIEIK